MGDILSWHIVGDWFDSCSCGVPCACIFAQAPSNGFANQCISETKPPAPHALLSASPSRSKR